MHVTLTPELERLVHDKVASGIYPSADVVVHEALRLLAERDRLEDSRLEGLRAEIRVGLDQADRGEFVDGPKAFERLRTRLRTTDASGT